MQSQCHEHAATTSNRSNKASVLYCSIILEDLWKRAKPVHLHVCTPLKGKGEKGSKLRAARVEMACARATDNGRATGGQRKPYARWVR